MLPSRVKKNSLNAGWKICSLKNGWEIINKCITTQFSDMLNFYSLGLAEKYIISAKPSCATNNALIFKPLHG
jgi:hypothetical protein